MNFEVAPKSTDIKSNWNEAKLYCQFLEYNGYTDWRLPTREELNKIWKTPNDLECDFYWTSTEDNDDNVWGQLMTNGMQICLGKNNHIIHVRAVRDI